MNHRTQNMNKNSTQKHKTNHRTAICITLSILLSILTSCGDFVDPPEVAQEVSSEPKMEQKQKTVAEPKHEIIRGETEEQRDWRLCEEERKWAFMVDLIDSNQLKLYQSRNFAPVFKVPGVRQAGIEGWYICRRALQLNGFIDFDLPTNPQGFVD